MVVKFDNVFVKYLSAACILFSSTFDCLASSYESNWAVPERVMLVQGQGFRVYGAYGNPGPNEGCQINNQIFVKSNHPQYDQIYSLVLLALASKKELFFHIRSCEPVGWIAGAQTLSTLVENGSVDIR